MIETWKEIKGFTTYQVSNLGNIKNIKSNYVLKIDFSDKTGYGRIGLLDSNKKKVKKLVHRLVLEAFVGPCPPGMEACHNNGVRSDNRLENLRWDTRKNNHKDKKLHGTHQSGSKVGTSILTECQVFDILYRFSQSEKQVKLAKEYNVHISSVHLIVKRKSWSNITSCSCSKHFDKILINSWNKYKHNTVLTDSVINSIKECVKNGDSKKDLALKLGISTTTINRALKNKIKGEII